MVRPLSPLLAAAAFVVACAHLPPPHPRAVENNQTCAQYIGQGDLTRAETYCNLALEFSPDYSEAWNNKGLIALKRKDNAAAKELFIKAIHYNQELAQAYNNLCYVYLQEKSFGHAHDNCARALKVNPDYTEARYNLALAYTGLKEPENAKKELRTLIAVNPNLADPHNSLGLLFLQEHAREEAVNEFLVAVQLDPNFGDAFLNLGNGYMELARYVEAADAFETCVRVDPENIPCRQNLPIANRLKALADPKLHEDGVPKTAAGFYQRAQAFREKGLRHEERQDLSTCIKLDGHFTPCHYALYQLFKEDQRVNDAHTACKNVLRWATAEDFPTEVNDCRKYLGGNPL
jgi:tetratricopeptide (TPR) repeat protein